MTYQVYWDSTPVVGWCWPIYPHRPMMNFTMGNLFSDTTPLNNGQEQPFLFLNAVTLGNAWTSYADGLSIAYYNGGVRGAQQTSPTTKYDFTRDANGQPIPKPGGGCVYDTPIALPTLANPKFTFYPNVDGIFNLDQVDFDDVAWIKSHLGWALTR